MTEFGEGAPEAKVPSEPNLEAIKGKEKISPGYPEVFERHWQMIPRAEACQLVNEYEFLGIKPSTKELSNLPESERRIIGDIRSIFSSVFENPRLLVGFPRRQYESGKMDYPKYEKWIAGVVGEISDSELATRMNEEHMREIFDALHKTGQDMRLYFEGVLEEELMTPYEGVKEELGTQSPLFFIEQFQDEYFQAIFTKSMIEGTKDIVGAYYPELVIEWPFLVQTFLQDNTEYGLLEGNRHLIVRGFDELGSKIGYRYDWTERPHRTRVYYKPDYKQDGRMFSLADVEFPLILHELMHGRIYEIWGGWRDKEYDSLAIALNEGFPQIVMFHLLSLVSRDAEIWGIGPKGRKELEIMKEGIDREKRGTEYEAGSSIYNELFKRGGVEEMIRFLRRVDFDRCNKIMEGSAEYEAALKDPDKIPMKPEAPAKTS